MPRSHHGYKAGWLIVVVLSIVVAGCQGDAPTDLAAPAVVQDRAQGKITPSETWDVLFIGDTKVGFAHTTIKIVGEGDQQQLDISAENELTLRRGNDETTMRIIIAGQHLADGTPLRFTASQQSGPVADTTRGEWKDGKLAITVERLGKTERQSFDWKPEYGGVFAKDLSLLHKALAAGESRHVKMFFPLMNVIGEVELAAKSNEATDMLGGKKSLLRVECTEVIGQTRMKSTLWLDKDGQIVKAHQPQVNMTSYRTTREVATGKSTGPTYDLLTGTIIKLQPPLKDPHSYSSITYKATLADGQIKSAFALGPTQSLKPLSEETGELTVRAIRPDRPAKLEKPDTPPTDDDLAANNLVQTGDPRIQQMAKSVAAGETDPWKVAVALEKLVQQSVKNKNFSQAFSSAAEVAASKEGDCTEHAVLLMALCRARNIPARGAMGLVYVSGLGGFGYHMWTEVWIKDRWVPLDGTLGQRGIGAAHIKLAHANLKGADAFSAFLPVLEVLGRLKLEVVATE